MAPASAAAAEGAEGEAPAAAAAEVAAEDAGEAAEEADVPAAEDAAAATVCQPPYVATSSSFCCDPTSWSGGPVSLMTSYRICVRSGGSTTTTANGVSTTTASSGGFQMPAMDASGCSIGSSGCVDMQNSGACVLLNSKCINGKKCARQSAFGMPSC